MEANYGYQFRRFGCATGGLPDSKFTVGVNNMAGWSDYFKRYRECAFMGIKVEWHPALFQTQLSSQLLQGAAAKPTVLRNNTWYDTIPDTIKGTAASAVAASQQYKPGETVPWDSMQLRRQTLQRHKPTSGWTKSCVNNIYAKQNNTEWFKTSDFYSINIVQQLNPTNPANIPNPLLRHNLAFVVPSADATNVWPQGQNLGSYFVTYSMKFRSIKDAEAE